MSGLPAGAPADAAALRDAALSRVAAVRARLGAGPVPGGLGVAVVVADLDVAAFVRCAAQFAMGVPADLREGWYQTFTRTVFLAGRPEAVALRHPHRLVTPDGNLAWHGPAARGALLPLSRLLRSFQGPRPVEVPAGPLTVTVPGPPSGHAAQVSVAVGDVSTGAYLVHVHHLIAEAVLRGLVGPGDTLRVGHRQFLDPAEFHDALDPARAGAVQTRIAGSGSDPDRLALFGVLTSDRNEGDH
ncbi:DUF6182 family protein [Streptomyces sp. NBC_00989]|uniref:DUF6182 family protein n=1 Tax=Streptomyces sp. NBC_00989 TaxID=2903705 RepID=UPI0038688F8E|nr:DUF6182 family protein [Streptomyces sp. NBC_00989]